MKNIEIVKMSHADDKRLFFSYMGEFFASKKIRAELGDCMSSDDSYTWWIAKNSDDEVMGFCAAEIKKIITLKHAYVLPEHRHLKLYNKLMSARMKYLKRQKKVMKVVASPDSVGVLSKRGFVKTGERGRYTLMTYTPA